MVARLLWLPLASLVAVLLYQGTNPALYYFIGIVAYFWAYSEGEVSGHRDIPQNQRLGRGQWTDGESFQVICAIPWTLPKRTDRRIQQPEKV